MRRLGFAIALLLATPIGLAAIITGPGATAGSPASEAALREIPADLLPVYQAAAVTCRGLPWQVLAAIGWIESRHAQGHADPTTGNVQPPIVGPAIDGRPGFAAIRDPSSSDGWAHALGPMQFLPATWGRWATLAPERPPGATPDVQNAWDAIHSAARYLCRDQPTIDDLRTAILSYNASEAYLEEVIAKAQEYGLGTPSAEPSLLGGSGDTVVAAALTQLGVPYVWGGSSPAIGFDCSGLVQWSYDQIGVALPRTTFEQVLVGVPISIEELRAGDLVFSQSVRDGVRIDLGHVAIYAGGGYVVVAPHTGAVVSLQPLAPRRVQAVRRVLQP